uniref:Uncharacterized protein n=1 Tax=Peronospora matthiolae TaxID=2874970 RepID=A0AAV1US53_9STRA
MKTCVPLLALFLATLASADESDHVKIIRHHHQSHDDTSDKSQHLNERGVANQEALTKKQEFFYSMTNMKSTPWDTRLAIRAEKCKDLCQLSSFWAQQEDRNCLNNPSSVCPAYKSGHASMAIVLNLAECTCLKNGRSSGSS